MKMDQRAMRKELRHFGILVGGIFAAIGFWPYVFQDEPARSWAIMLGGTLVALGTLMPQLLAPIHKGWMWIGHVLGWINTRILLGIVFYGIVTPLGWIGRLLGKDYMRLRLKEPVETYRHPKVPRPADHMQHPF